MGEFLISNDCTKVISEHSNYKWSDYLVAENEDNFILSSFTSAFEFPQKLNSYDGSEPETVDDFAADISKIKNIRLVRFILSKCVNCIN